MSSSYETETERQRRQWNEFAESLVEFVRGSRNHYAEYLNGPALKDLAGDVAGKRMLDIGCGEGKFARLFAGMGAEVVGIDLSDSLIRAAMEEEERHPLGVRYLVSDAADLSMLEPGSFDIAYFHMSLMDIPNYEGAISETSRVLRTGGRLLVVMIHPCFSVRFMDGRMVGGWEKQPREDGSMAYLYYRVEDYFTRHSYENEWKSDRLTGSHVTTGYHRTLSDIVNALIGHGLFITRMEEPRPMERGIELHPPMGKHLRVPFSLALEATKPRRQ